MVRAIGGIVLGYVTMSVFVFATFSLLYLALGADRSFRPGTYDVSSLWVVASFVLGFLGAALGGFVGYKMGGGTGAPKILAALVFVMGVATALMMPAPSPEPKVRTAEVGNLEAMTEGVTPPWINWANPVVGVVGVLFGAGILGRRRDAGAAFAGGASGSGGAS